MSARKKTPKADDVLVPVDAALKAAWTKLAAQIDALSAKEMSDFDARWEAVTRVVEHDPPLYLFGGYKTATEFFTERLKVDRRTATRNMRVARHASPRDEDKYGPTNIDAVLSYLEAKHGALDGVPIAFDRLRIEIPDGKGTKTVRFPDATALQIKAATRLLLKKQSKAPANPTRAALEDALSDHAAFERVVVHERAGLATFANVPVASLGLFGRALAGVKLPAKKTADGQRDPKSGQRDPKSGRRDPKATRTKSRRRTKRDM